MQRHATIKTTTLHDDRTSTFQLLIFNHIAHQILVRIPSSNTFILLFKESLLNIPYSVLVSFFISHQIIKNRLLTIFWYSNINVLDFPDYRMYRISLTPLLVSRTSDNVVNVTGERHRTVDCGPQLQRYTEKCPYSMKNEVALYKRNTIWPMFYCLLKLWYLVICALIASASAENVRYVSYAVLPAAYLITVRYKNNLAWFR